jgi:hypothetical protein
MHLPSGKHVSTVHCLWSSQSASVWHSTVQPGRTMGMCVHRVPAHVSNVHSSPSLQSASTRQHPTMGACAQVPSVGLQVAV